MMKQKLIISALWILFLAAGCVLNQSRGEISLHELRTSLDLVEKAPANEFFQAPHQYDVSTLVGLSRKKIESILGTPSQCSDAFMPAPCENKGDWFYSFYKFPEPKDGIFYLGGGPELLLQFGQDNICTSAGWFMTQ